MFLFLFGQILPPLGAFLFKFIVIKGLFWKLCHKFHVAHLTKFAESFILATFTIS